MKFLIQRVKEAAVTTDGELIGKIGPGFLVLAGVSDSDTTQTADKMIKKLLSLRIFEDENGKTNLSLQDVCGELLIVSQFTLYADCKKGNRPSFTRAGSPEHANTLYEYILAKCQETYAGHIAGGRFGANMQVSLVNDGPFTVLLDSDEL